MFKNLFCSRSSCCCNYFMIISWTRRDKICYLEINKYLLACAVLFGPEHFSIRVVTNKRMYDISNSISGPDASINRQVRCHLSLDCWSIQIQRIPLSRPRGWRLWHLWSCPLPIRSGTFLQHLLVPFHRHVWTACSLLRESKRKYPRSQSRKMLKLCPKYSVLP